MSAAITVNDFAAALLGPVATTPKGVTTARGRSDAARFAVYRNNVFVALVDALAARFPVTLRLTGEAFFRAMARAFAADHRPESPILARYGDRFPDFVEGFPPAAGVPYLADVARLEAAWTDAYHAADAPALPAERLGDWLPATLTRPVDLHPSAHLIRSSHPVGSIWAAHAEAEVGPIPSWTAETVLIVRPDADVQVHRLPVADSVFAAALFAGRTLADAAEDASADPAFDFGRALVGIARLGAFIDPFSE
ncbi:DNA-binding domain-containing protein [Chthonobacter albigriseus]|uniref:HvfC/BufC N-terminal domain-containing protein n=1 Tax=Chthonobacter albigriseus TaxID=1683161 RepID=UPI0015EE3D36|nr:DNA-binding domain-containing protein [Chthonobacter albigriseus]